LPEGFTFDAGWPWIKAIQFGRSIQIANAKAHAETVAAAERSISDIGSNRRWRGPCTSAVPFAWVRRASTIRPWQFFMNK
jgi:hypothetical protein